VQQGFATAAVVADCAGDTTATSIADAAAMDAAVEDVLQGVVDYVARLEGSEAEPVEAPRARGFEVSAAQVSPALPPGSPPCSNSRREITPCPGLVHFSPQVLPRRCHQLKRLTLVTQSTCVRPVSVFAVRTWLISSRALYWRR
jgi:hypothetical protein